MSFCPPDDPAVRFDRWKRRAEREQAARHEAERLLESKSLELFEANRRLTELNANLEERVRTRTAQLARAAQARSEFLAAMSHEIRTPMTAVLGMIDLLRAEPLTPKQKEYVESVHSSGRHLLVIINDILDFSRIESGKIELEQDDFSLRAVVEGVRAMLEPLAREQGLELRCDLPAALPAIVRGDSTRLKQVLLNLGSNAIKFTPQGSVIIALSTESTEHGHRFRFEVSDTGIGISEADSAQLFGAFTQADRSTSRKYGGSGLGLAISKRLVEAMGGTIGVRRNIGRGSTFWFEVELPESEAASGPANEAPVALASARRILVAEDIALNRDMIRAMLQRDGHKLTFATHGGEAVDLVRQSEFDLVIMDVQMPVMDGIEATRHIRRLQAPKGAIPIIALTANVMAAEQQECLGAGMDAVLMKPIDWDRLRSTIADCSAG